MNDVDAPTVITLALRLLLAAALGGLVGFEREYRGQAAGFRTHILVSVGAALFTLVGVYAAHADPSVDSTRIAAQVVTGIGFLGAGAIIQQGASVRGLTTAATLWVTAAVGTACGLGYLSGAALASVVTVFSLVVFKMFERRLFPQLAHPERNLMLVTAPNVRLATVTRAVEDGGGRVLATRLADEDGQLELTLAVRMTGGASYDDLLQSLAGLQGVRHAAWTR